MGRVIKVLLLFAVILGAFVSWQTHEYYSQPLPLTTETIVTVSEGESLQQISRDLMEKQVLSSTDSFVLWARIFGHDKKIKVGEYSVAPNTSMAGLFDILTSGKSIGYRVVVPEGFNMYEVALAIEQAGLASSATILQIINNRKLVKSMVGEDLPSLEGYLFPDTYFFTKADGAKTIVKKMVQRFLDKYPRVGKRQGWTRHQIVILASIIEKETGAPFERPQISSVFHNRMLKQMRLQTDPTVLYGKLLDTGNISTNITKMDLLTDNPYNTYTRKGLPPGPISNPGIEALQAAVSPAQTEYLFFVSKNDGTHVFSADYKAHEKAVKDYQLNARARAGKSWRDLKKGTPTGTGTGTLSGTEATPPVKK